MSFCVCVVGGGGSRYLSLNLFGSVVWERGEGGVPIPRNASACDAVGQGGMGCLGWSKVH